MLRRLCGYKLVLDHQTPVACQYRAKPLARSLQQLQGATVRMRRRHEPPAHDARRVHSRVHLQQLQAAQARQAGQQGLHIQVLLEVPQLQPPQVGQLGQQGSHPVAGYVAQPRQPQAREMLPEGEQVQQVRTADVALDPHDRGGVHGQRQRLQHCQARQREHQVRGRGRAHADRQLPQLGQLGELPGSCGTPMDDGGRTGDGQRAEARQQLGAVDEIDRVPVARHLQVDQAAGQVVAVERVGAAAMTGRTK
jgi:hypothetical protein